MSTSNTGVVQFLHLDHQGGFLFSTYVNGGLASYQNYGPWGDTHVTSGAQPTDINFTGQRLDATGLLDYNARKYNQGVARFIGADSILPNKYDSEGINRYSYVTNNPVNYIDPSGHLFCLTNIGCGPAGGGGGGRGGGSVVVSPPSTGAGPAPAPGGIGKSQSV